MVTAHSHGVQSKVWTSVNFRAYCPNSRPQQSLCGHNNHTYPTAIQQYASAMGVPRTASGGVVGAFELPYSWKVWRELNLADWPQPA